MDNRILETDYQTKITVMDDKGSGGACHRYLIERDGISLGFIKFQEGPIKRAGINGCTQEDLLNIVIDRLRCFQDGPYSCEENARALKKIEESLGWLRYRTSDRIRRGVEGLNQR